MSLVRFGLPRGALASVVLAAATFALGYAARPLTTRPAAPPPAVVAPHPTPPPADGSVVRGRPGPWGELEYTPITISAPEELLPVRALEETPTRWFVPVPNRDGLVQYLSSLGLPRDQADALADPSAVATQVDGMVVTPPRDVLLSLPPAARGELYKRLSSLPANGSAFPSVRADGLDERFRKGGVSKETADLFKRLSWDRGDYFVFSGMSVLLPALPTYEEKVRFLKALTAQKTMLVRLRVPPGADVRGLSNYWGKVCWNTDVRSLLESLAALPGGASLDLIELLPPFPTAHLYTYPIGQNPLAGPTPRRDCHWTSFNFFRDVPDNRYNDTAYLVQKIKDDHYPVTADPRYGDVVLLGRADGSIVHSAVYLADGLVYTKNGDTPIHPWMFSTLADMVDHYSYQAEPGQRLTVTYFRNKYY